MIHSYLRSQVMDDLISLAETLSNASTLLADGVPGEGSTGPSNLLQVVAIGTMVRQWIKIRWEEYSLDVPEIVTWTD